MSRGDGNNCHVYCHNNPINFIDPLGLCSESTTGIDLGAGFENTELPPKLDEGAITGDPLLFEILAGSKVIPKIVNIISDLFSKQQEFNDSSTPVGRRGNPLEVESRTNKPTTIDGRNYSGHAVDRMQGRGIPPSVIENTIQNGTQTAGNTQGTTVSVLDNVTAITNSNGDVITVILK